MISNTYQIAQIYAKSLLDIDVNNALIQLRQIEEVLKNSADLRDVLENSSVNIHSKIEILDKIFQNKIDEKLINFLKVLTEKKRISEFSNIIDIYEKSLYEKNNVKFVEIISAIDITEDYKQKILRKLEEKLQYSVTPNWVTDPNIIGGLVFKYEDTVIDSSLKSKIENFSKTMK